MLVHNYTCNTSVHWLNVTFIMYLVTLGKYMYKFLPNPLIAVRSTSASVSASKFSAGTIVGISRSCSQ